MREKKIQNILKILLGSVLIVVCIKKTEERNREGKKLLDGKKVPTKKDPIRRNGKHEQARNTYLEENS